MIRYLFDANGGFLYGDDRIASYAYPTSPLAERAKRGDPATAASVSLEQEQHTLRMFDDVESIPEGRFKDHVKELIERNTAWLAKVGRSNGVTA